MPTITDWLMVGITVVYVIATIAICWANIQSANASKAQVEEMRKQYAEEHSPQIEVELIYEKRLFWGLRFINHGRCTANNVKIELASEFVDSILEEKIAFLLRKQNGKTCTIGVGQHYDLYFGTNKYLKNPNKVAASGTISYCYNGVNKQTDFHIDIENYATIFSVNSEYEDLLKALKNQTAELKRIYQAISGIETTLEEQEKDA